MTERAQLSASALKDRVNLAVYAEQFVRLRKSGGQYVGLCPFHQERLASFYVDSRRWYCFGCWRGGELFSFIMSIHGCGFRRAIEIAAAFSDGVASPVSRKAARGFGLA